MWYKIIFLLSQYIIYDKNGFLEAKPMIGNLRAVVQGQYRWIVSIKTINNNDEEQEKYHGSTGSLISQKHVLTVEHGPKRVPLNRLECRLSTIDIRNDQWKYNISAMISYNQWAAANRIQPEYDENDIAILTLAQQVPDEIEPVNLSQIPKDLLMGLEARVAGWGLGSDNKVQRFMTYGIVKIIKKNECKDRIFNATGRVTDLHKRYLCTYGDPYVILRRGDSGGPIFLQNGVVSELIGITYANCPKPDGLVHPLKVNIHIGIHTYRIFIVNIITRF